MIDSLPQPLPFFRGSGCFFVVLFRFITLPVCLVGFSGVFFVSLSVSAASYPEEIQKLADSGDPEAQLSLALFYEYGDQGMGRDLDKSLFWLEKSASLCLPCACLYLGIKYENGSGAIRNPAKAARFYRCAARQDWPAAQLFLGRLCASGKGIKQDLPQALAWFALAAEHTYPGAAIEYETLLAKMKGGDLRVLKEMKIRLLGEKPFCD